MLKTNCKRQFLVRHLALDVCDLYRFSYENVKELFHLKSQRPPYHEFPNNSSVDFQMETKSHIFTHWLKIISKHVLRRLVYKCSYQACGMNRNSR